MKSFTRVDKMIWMVIVSLFVLTLTSCIDGDAVELVREDAGTKIEIKLRAEEDNIISWETESEISNEMIGEEYVDRLINQAEEKGKEVNKVPGCSYKVKKEDDGIKISIFLDINEDTISKLIDLDMIVVDEDNRDVSVLSLEKTVEDLESAGFVVDK